MVPIRKLHDHFLIQMVRLKDRDTDLWVAETSRVTT